MTIHYQAALTARRVLDDVLPEAVSHDSPGVVEHSCPRCGGVMLYPLIARDVDVERVQCLISAIESFAKVHGVSNWMRKKLIAECRAAIQRREGES